MALWKSQGYAPRLATDGAVEGSGIYITMRKPQDYADGASEELKVNTMTRSR